MADDDNNQGDMKYHQNQPYDMEIDLNNDGDDEENNTNEKKELNKEVEDDHHKGIDYELDNIQVKKLPRFDLSKFNDLPVSAEAKELLSIMKK